MKGALPPPPHLQKTLDHQPHRPGCLGASRRTRNASRRVPQVPELLHGQRHGGHGGGHAAPATFGLPGGRLGSWEGPQQRAQDMGVAFFVDRTLSLGCFTMRN